MKVISQLRIEKKSVEKKNKFKLNVATTHPKTLLARLELEWNFMDIPGYLKISQYLYFSIDIETRKEKRV